jgi:hypothetical protein
VNLAGTDISEELIAPIFRMGRISELIPLILKIEAVISLIRQFLQEPHGITSQKMILFIVRALKTSNVT